MGKKVTGVQNQPHHFLFWCPGCKMAHGFNAGEGSTKPVWKFNFNMECPTLSPSYLTWWDSGPEKIKHRCHSFIKNGKIQFLGDCTHDLKNQTVELPDFDKEEK